MGNTKKIVWIHLLYWTIQHGIIFVFYILLNPKAHSKVPFGFLLDYVFFYSLYFFIFPRLLKREFFIRYLFVYLMATVVYFMSTQVIWNFTAVIRFEYKFHIATFDNIISSWMGNSIGAAALLSLSYWLKSEEKKRTLKIQSSRAELLFLKNQMNPHFLFNTINNIYALSLQNSFHTTTSLKQLKTMLSYLLEFEGMSKIPIQKEVDFVRSTIDLNRLRCADFVNIEFRYNNSSAEPVMIEPLLLVCFVENAFKHGDTFTPDAQINIELDCSSSNLIFQVQNAIVSKFKDKVGGIGIQNVIKRLDLLYHERYKLEIKEENGWYNVLLKVEWK